MKTSLNSMQTDELFPISVNDDQRKVLIINCSTVSTLFVVSKNRQESDKQIRDSPTSV